MNQRGVTLELADDAHRVLLLELPILIHPRQLHDSRERLSLESALDRKSGRRPASNGVRSVDFFDNLPVKAPIFERLRIGRPSERLQLVHETHLFRVELRQAPKYPFAQTGLLIQVIRPQIESTAPVVDR